MKVNIKHIALSISVAVVLFCVFTGVSGIASPDAQAEFRLFQGFYIGTEDDILGDGTYERNMGYWLEIYNEDDASDTILGDLEFSAQADNITGVDWEEYAEWNGTSVNWTFPPEYEIYEDDDFGTGFETNYSTSRYLGLYLKRSVNQTVFNSDGYQLAEFDVTFKDKNVEWAWGCIETNEYDEICASIVTFDTDAPLDEVEESEHGVYFDFNKSQIQTDVPYNFSVVIKIEMTGSEVPPILYKPEFAIIEGLDELTADGEEGFTVEMPPELLPDNVNYVYATTNVSNHWSLYFANCTFAALEEVVELAGACAQFHLNKDFHVRTEDDLIINGTYECNIGYWMDIENVDDTRDTVLGNLSFSVQADNITDVGWEEYAEWNESHVEWIFPSYPEFIIEEDDDFWTGFGTSYSETRDVNVRLSRWMNITVFDSDAYQLAEFNVTFRDGDFMWCWGDVEVTEHHEVRASIVPDTFWTDAPLDWVDVEEDGVHFEFDKGQIQKDIPYNFSVVIKVELTGNEAPPILYKPEFYIGQGIYYNESTPVGKRDTAEMPEDMLPENVSYASVTTNVSNYWTLKRHNQMIAVLGEVVELAGPRAKFSLDNNFGIGTQDDSITSGTYDSSLGYHMDIYNEDDDSDTVLGNITFSIQPENNITGVDWGEYAEWNGSYAEWEFPPEFIIEEDEGFGTGLGTSYSEPKYFNLNMNRWFNQTSFNETAYQLVNFSVEFEDENFEWLWGNINANEHEEVYASIVPGTFSYEAPLDGFEEWDHGIHFDFDKDEIETGVTYNFSVVVKVEPTMPIMYKPDITIGEGLYSNSTAGETGYTAEMPSYMLPENVSYASVTTNVSNVWCFGRYNHLITCLGEVVELAGPHAEFEFNKDFNVRTEDDTITSGTYERKIKYGMGIHNEDDDSDTVLGDLRFGVKADNITKAKWNEYAEWNESYIEWAFPPKFVIHEDDWHWTGFKTNYSETRFLNVNTTRWMNQTIFSNSGYQLAKFDVTFEDKNFKWVWANIEANDHHELDATIVPGTFTYNAPLDNFDVWDHGIHLNFDKERIETGVTYNFSVLLQVELTGKEAPPILYKPKFRIGEGLYHNSTILQGYTAEMPSSILPDNVSYASVTTNVSNAWLLKRHDHTIAELDEVVELTGPHAEFEFNKDFNVWTKNDTIASGTYERNKWYWMHIENVEDTSGTALSNLSFSARADNITNVDWEEYADWNESSVEWHFPAYPEFIIDEDEGFGTGFSRGSEIGDVNVSLSRWMNKTVFNSIGYEYQLAKFNVTFDDTNFEWVWARIEANDHHEIDASIVPGTFTYDAPVNDFDEWDHGIHFDFDKEQIQIGVPYNFSVLIKVELTGKEAPPILYKPRFEIGEGLYYNSTTGDEYEIVIATEMLPDNVSYASASTNVSNVWLIKSHNHIIAGLEEVSELTGPHALFSTDNVFPVATENDTIHRGTYERNMWCRLNIKNSDDTSDTVLGDLNFNGQADNITVVNWEEHAVWNKTSVSWTFPSDFVIYEDDWFGTGFGTNYTEIRHLNVEVSRQMNQTMFNNSACQLANFTITFEDTDFQWCGGRIEANEHYEVNASIVPGTFESDAPLDWFNEWEHGVRFGFDRDAIETGVAYKSSVVIKVNLTGNRAPPIVYKPLFFINVEHEKSFAPGGEGFTAVMPPEMLPSYVNNALVTTNISNNWTLRQVNRTIAKLKEVYGSTRIDARIFDVYMNTLPAMPNATFSRGSHENRMALFNRIENPTSTSILSPSMLLETQKPVMDYETADVEEFSYDFISENSSKFNWSLYDIPPHEEVRNLVAWSEMESKDYGYEASVSVDKFEFSSLSEQNLNITVDVYDNSSMEKLHIEAYPFDEDAVKNHDFVSVEFIGWSSDTTPAHFTADQAIWAIQNPEAKRYTFSVKVSVTPHLSCAYKPGVDVRKHDFIDEYLVNSSSEITPNTWAGNYIISMDEARDWVVYSGNASVSSFPMIAAENPTTISGYVKDDNGKPIENVGVFVSIWNNSEYQDYVKTSTNESGYYEAFVKDNEKYRITAGWTRPDYTTEEVENIAILPHTENFTLHNASVVCGGVFDADKKSMQGVEVMVVDGFKEAISSDFTNEDGYHRQLKIPEHGNYTVKVEGYDSNELELSDVGKGEAMLHNFVVELPPIFDTSPSKNPYPSIMGIHEGKIKPSCDISVSRLYTYPCAGTGGHTKSIELYENDTLIANGTWSGYKDDWHNITITPSVTLWEGHEYRYIIRTGSYPQIIHEHEYKNATGGTITCTSFVDANGKTYTDWIPAIRLE